MADSIFDMKKMTCRIMAGGFVTILVIAMTVLLASCSSLVGKSGSARGAHRKHATGSDGRPKGLPVFRLRNECEQQHCLRIRR